MARPASRHSLFGQSRELGLDRGDAVMVHAGVRSVGPIIGGVNVLVQALLDAIGETGTLVAYVDWESGFDEPFDAAYADQIPAFDKRIARAARDHGILAEVVRTWPGAVRSDNPDAGVTAIGRLAARLCEGHSMSYGYGARSPYAKLVEIGGKVVTIGAPLNTITMLHHAEHLARIAGKQIKRYRRKVDVDGDPRWIDIEEFETSSPIVAGMPDDHFMQIATTAYGAGHGRKGAFGAAEAYVFDAASLVRIGVDWLERWQAEP